ncbi:hypothetical protein PIROE2DRAFT_8496 [Piromyces sp. E2]|nr:hypothetical protein PIROE2DRAFT_8496 [Piromyces sp. E2]|eukprot:OUM64658.1 hypothetical protein PIROE2DRAFT_8496 [Piromyces sp. E2]
MKNYKDKINFRNKIKIKADKYINADSINSTFTTARAITAALIYVILVLLRIIYAFLPAYFHPNEYYEKTELKDFNM